MLRADFYVIAGTEPEARLNFACHLARTAQHKGAQLYVYCDSDDVLTILDDLLWTFHPASFVPHWKEREVGGPGLVLGTGAAPCGDTLLNLGTALPEWTGDFARSLEIVTPEPAVRRITRASYRHYRDHGYELHTHNTGS